MTTDRTPAEILIDYIGFIDRMVFPGNAADVKNYSSNSGIKMPPGQPFAAYCSCSVLTTDRRRLAKKPFGLPLRFLFYWLERCCKRKKIFCRWKVTEDFYLIFEENINRRSDRKDRFSLMSIAAHEVRHRLQMRCPKKISRGLLSKLRRTSWANRELGISKWRYLSLLMDYQVLVFIDKREWDCQFIEELIKRCSASDWDKIVKIVMM